MIIVVQNENIDDDIPLRAVLVMFSIAFSVTIVPHLIYAYSPTPDTSAQQSILSNH